MSYLIVQVVKLCKSCSTFWNGSTTSSSPASENPFRMAFLALALMASSEVFRAAAAEAAVEPDFFISHSFQSHVCRGRRR